jgi:hypothetical protein
MRRLHRFGDLLSQGKGFIDRKRPALQSRGESLTLDEFKDQESRSPVFLNVMDDTDVWMIQGCQNLRLALEPGEPARIVRESLREHLDRNVTPQLTVSGPVDLSHAADTDQLKVLV